MHLIDEEQDLALRFDDLIENALQTFLKLAAILRTSHQRAHIQRIQNLILQGFRHIASHDAARQALDDCRLADTRLADEHRIVLRPARQDLDRTTDLLIAADHRVQLAMPRGIREIAAIFLERLIALLRMIARDILLAVLLDRCHDLALRKPELMAGILHL